jgi:hypothetical protein
MEHPKIALAITVGFEHDLKGTDSWKVRDILVLQQPMKNINHQLHV